MSRGSADETARVRRIYDRMAPRYDRMIAVAERLLFGDGRHWVCAQAGGEALEIAVGTGRMSTTPTARGSPALSSATPSPSPTGCCAPAGVCCLSTSAAPTEG